jgi:hypothetical protein
MFGIFDHLSDRNAVYKVKIMVVFTKIYMINNFSAFRPDIYSVLNTNIFSFNFVFGLFHATPIGIRILLDSEFFLSKSEHA